MAKSADELGEVGLRAPDRYEQEYMGGAGRVLHREKVVGPWYYQLIFALPLLAIIGSMIIPAITAGEAITEMLGVVGIGVGTALLAFLLWMIFAVIRVTVSTDEFHVQFGLFGPRVPVESIDRIEAVDYDWKEFGGWGIKRSFKDGAWIYNMLGDSGRGIRVTYRDKRGKITTVVVGTPNADVVADALKQAVLRKVREPGKVRIEDDAADPAAATEALAVEEALAEEEASAEGTGSELEQGRPGG